MSASGTDQRYPIWGGLYLDCTLAGPFLTVSYERALSEHFALRIRRTELRTKLRSTLKKLGRVSQYTDYNQVDLYAPTISKIALVRFMETLEQRISMVATRPLSSRLVERLLSISASERLRWTKLGYLRSQGNQRFQRGQYISVCCYPVDLVSHLAANPDIISGWRVTVEAQGNQV